jgi:hypothetical protein
VFPLLYLPKVIAFSICSSSITLVICYLWLYKALTCIVFVLNPFVLLFVFYHWLADVNVGDFLHYSYHFSTAFHCVCVTPLLIL